MYCGADLTLSADEAMAASVDVAKGLFINLLDQKGNLVLSGMMRAQADGLHITGYPAGGDEMTINAGAVAADVALIAALYALGSPLCIPETSPVVGHKEPASREIVLTWQAIAAIENRCDKIRLTVRKELPAGRRMETKREQFDIVLRAIPKGQDKRYGMLCDHLLKYKKDPTSMPRCPACNHGVAADVRRCVYCGATW